MKGQTRPMAYIDSLTNKEISVLNVTDANCGSFIWPLSSQTPKAVSDFFGNKEYKAIKIVTTVQFAGIR